MGEVGGPRVYMVRAYINHVSVAVNTPFARKVRTPSYPGPRQCRCSSHGATADFVDRKTVRKK